jgi:hypothetical protein
MAMCLRYMQSFQLNSFRDFVQIAKLILSDPLHYISLSFYANTSAPHGFDSSFLPITQATLIQSETIQAFFPRISNGMFLFSASSQPRKINILNISTTLCIL